MASVLLAALVGVVIVSGVAVVAAVYHRQWHVRLRRQIRRLPEHRRKERV